LRSQEMLPSWKLEKKERKVSFRAIENKSGKIVLPCTCRKCTFARHVSRLSDAIGRHFHGHPVSICIRHLRELSVESLAFRLSSLGPFALRC
jgi:hypothetical protein